MVSFSVLGACCLPLLGCGAPRVPVITADHPACLDAMTAAIPPAPAILDVQRADRRDPARPHTMLHLDVPATEQGEGHDQHQP